MVKYTTNKTKIRKDILLVVMSGICLRDDFTCQKTGDRVYWKNCHPSHVIPQSADKRLAMEQRNIKVLSYRSHINRRHKNPLESWKWYEETFPENAERLKEQHKKNIGRWSISLFEYRDYAESWLRLLEKYDWVWCEHFSPTRKEELRLAKNRLLKFIEYMNEE